MLWGWNSTSLYAGEKLVYHCNTSVKYKATFCFQLQLKRDWYQNRRTTWRSAKHIFRLWKESPSKIYTITGAKSSRGMTLILTVTIWPLIRAQSVNVIRFIEFTLNRIHRRTQFRSRFEAFLHLQYINIIPFKAFAHKYHLQMPLFRW